MALLFLLSLGGIWGQQPGSSLPAALRFDHFSTPEGLSQVTVLAALQDRRGFLWFGTQNGLNRYDGYEFVVYRSDADDSLSLSSNFIYALYEDRDGFIWVGTRDGGLNRFDPRTETFRRYQHDPRDSTSLSGSFVHAITQDRQGNLWVGAWGHGLNRLDKANHRFIRYQADPADPAALSSNIVTCLLPDPSGALWIGSFGGGLNRFDHVTGTFTYYRHDPADPNSLSANQVMGLLADTTGAEPVLWVATSHGGLNRFNPATGRFTHYRHDPADPLTLSSDLVHQLHQDRQRPDWLWVGTWGGGLCRFDKRSGRFYTYRNDPNDPHSLSSNTVYPIVEDRAGRLWLGTQSGGINRIDPAKQRFRHYRKSGAAGQRLSDNNINSLLRDRSGNLWVGLESERLNRVDGRTGQLQVYNLLPAAGPVSGFRIAETRGLLEAPDGMIWITTRGAGLIQLNPRTGQTRHFLADPEKPGYFPGNDLTVLYPARRGGFWIGSFNRGLYHFDPATGQTRNFQHNPADTLSLSGKEVYSLMEDAAGRLWVGTRTDGLNLKLPDSDQFERFQQRNDGLISNSIYAIHESPRLPGVIWLGTEQGLNALILPPNAGERFGDQVRFDHYLEKDGLPGNVVYGILEDDEGYLWLSTSKGLVQFRLPAQADQRGQIIRSFFKSDGLTANEFNYGAHHRAPDGELLFGGVEGVTAFYPEQVRASSGPATLALTTFEKFTSGQAGAAPIAVQGIEELDDLTLSYRDNIFTVGFALLNYAGADRNQYFYRLEGFANNWIPLGANRRLTFTNLDPGRYRLQIRGAVNGETDFAERTLNLYIRPPWWRTGWAYGLFSLLLGGALALLWRYEMNRLRIKEQLRMEHVRAAHLHEIDQLKSRFFANISHEFRTPLTLILGPVDQLLAAQPEPEQTRQYHLIKRNAQRLLRLINQLLDLSKLEAGKMQLELEYADLVPLLSGLFHSFESLAQSKRIRLVFNSELESAFLHFDRDKMEQIFSNLISNAVKFTPEGGEVRIKVGTSDGGRRIQIDVADTGPGVPRQDLIRIFDRFYQSDGPARTGEPGSGIGLALVKELAALHGGDVSVNNTEGQGACFTIRLPYEPERSSPENARLSGKVFQISTLPEASIAPSLPGEPSTADESETENTLLLVEDNPDMRSFLREALADSYRIIEAADGQEGVEKALEWIPDIIVSDVMMPRKDGLQLCDALKNDERSSHIPIILLTAKADVESRIAGLKRGADAYLAKPFHREELLAHTHNLIQWRRRLRARYASSAKPSPTTDQDIQIEDAFLQKVRGVIEQHLSDSTFEIDQLARLLGMSRSQLFRKIKALTGQSPSLFIRSIRLHRGRELLQTTDLNISEVAYEVGFSTPAYFSDAFTETFGLRPSQVRK